MDYKVEEDFIHSGLRCVVVATNMGHRCGYVEVPKGHLLHNLSYNSSSEHLKNALERRKNKPMGENPSFACLLTCLGKDLEASPDMVFEVHGGITYSSGDGKYPVESKGWWFGFDCSHCDDGKDISLMDEKFKEIEEKYNLGRDKPVRSREYVRDECVKLAEQFYLVGCEQTV